MAISGPNSYLTNITANFIQEAIYMVMKTECNICGPNIRWVRSPEMQMRLEEKKIGAGKTKEAFKVSFFYIL
jgi:hypothetical protein